MLATNLKLLRHLSNGEPRTGPLDTLTEVVVGKELAARLRSMKEEGYISLREATIDTTDEHIVHVRELQITEKGKEALARHS